MRRGTLVAVSMAVCLWAGGSSASAVAEGPTVRFATTLGDIDVLLLSDEAPKTVANFLGYVDRGDYSGTFFHRSVSGFVVQGGGFRFTSGQPAAIPQQPSVANEFKVSNTRGTLAMAKLPGDPNSATNQWFFNESNANAANLDTQNGGFTVFGRVANSAGLSVMDAIGTQRIVDASGTFGGTFDALPVVGYPTGSTPAGDNLVYVTSITRVPTVSTDTTAPTIVMRTPRGNQRFALGAAVTPDVTCDDGDGSGVATCAMPASVDTSTLGAHRFTVDATDNAGNSATTTVTYYVDPAPPAPPAPPAQDATTTAPLAPATTLGSTTTTAPTPATPAAALVGAVRTSAKGVVTMSLRCSATRRCTGQVRLVASRRVGSSTRRVTLGSQRYAIAARRAGPVLIRLGRTGRRLLERAHGRLTATLTLTPTGRSAAAVERRVTLRSGR